MCRDLPTTTTETRPFVHTVRFKRYSGVGPAGSTAASPLVAGIVELAMAAASVVDVVVVVVVVTVIVVVDVVIVIVVIVVVVDGDVGGEEVDGGPSSSPRLCS